MFRVWDLGAFNMGLRVSAGSMGSPGSDRAFMTLLGC